MPAATRYADQTVVLDVLTPTIALQLAHRSVRKFIPGDVTDAQLASIVAAAQSAATSSNLQAWSVVAVRDQERKSRLATLANNQQFIREAPLFLVWIADLSRAGRLAERAGVALDAVDYIETTIVGFVDAALAAQNATVAAESLGLGAVFVGAIRNQPQEVAAELSLPPRAVATFGLAVGVPDPTEHAAVKPRLPQQVVLHHERYDADDEDLVALYDQRLAGYNASYGLPGNWSDRVLARLAGGQSLPTRTALRGELNSLGFPSR